MKKMVYKETEQFKIEGEHGSSKTCKTFPPVVAGLQICCLQTSLRSCSSRHVDLFYGIVKGSSWSQIFQMLIF